MLGCHFVLSLTLGTLATTTMMMTDTSMCGANHDEATTRGSKNSLRRTSVRVNFLPTFTLTTKLSDRAVPHIPSTTAMIMRNPLVTTAFLLLVFSSMSTHALSVVSSRRQWLSQGASVAATAGAAIFGNAPRALATADSSTSTKLTNLSNEDFTKMLEQDINEKQFLVTGNISRELYDESCSFQDEIDTYGMDQWIVGTGRLFNGAGSSLRLASPIQVTATEASFKFDEDLMFNIPLKPVVHLTGTLYLTRDATTGLITSYKEKWDQGVWEVLKSAKI